MVLISYQAPTIFVTIARQLIGNSQYRPDGEKKQGYHPLKDKSHIVNEKSSTKLQVPTYNPNNRAVHGVKSQRKQ